MTLKPVVDPDPPPPPHTHTNILWKRISSFQSLEVEQSQVMSI